MKNSLFKRAVAAAAAVPLALTQCLTSFSAIAADDAQAQSSAESASQSYDLERLLYIAPDKTESEWNFDVDGALGQIVSKGKTTGTIDTGFIVDAIKKNAGKYADVFAEIAIKATEEPVTYEITSSKDIVIKGKVTQPDFNGNIDYTLGKKMSELAQKYNAPSLNKIDFSSVDVAGEYTLTIKTSALKDGTTVPVEFKFENGGKSYGPGELAGFAKQKLAELEQVADAAIDAAGITDATAKKSVANAIESYNKRIDKVIEYATKAFGTFSKDYSDSNNIAGLLADVNAKLESKGYSIPTTGAALAADSRVSDAYSKIKSIVNEAGNSAVTFDIEAADLGAFADSLTGVKVDAANGTAKLVGYFEDAEYDEVVAYYAEQNLKVVSDTKELTATVDFSGYMTSGASVDVKIKRIVETEPIETETTTSTDTTTTTTTTTSTTTTTDTDTSTTTTTTSTTSTTTTTTTTTTSTTTTTTTTTEPPIVTIAVQDIYVDFDSDYGFYIDMDKEFSTNQIRKAILHVTYVEGYTDAEGNKVITGEGAIEDRDISADLSFGDNTPGNVYDVTKTDFRYDVPVFYNGEDIEINGQIVVAKGDALKDDFGDDITVSAYIALLGDVNLDNKVDGRDATRVLNYYADLSAGEAGADVDPTTVKISTSDLSTSANSVYDHFAAFLGDVRTEIADSENWSIKKPGRLVDARDASAILNYYADLSIPLPAGRETWGRIIEKYAD